MLVPALAAIRKGYPVTDLEREGFEVATAGDGEQPVALARELDPDVIVPDLMLPRIDGIEARRQIRAFSDAYIVILTVRVRRSTGSSGSPPQPTTTTQL